MLERIAADGHRFGSLVESILTGSQFLNKRGRDDPREGRWPTSRFFLPVEVFDDDDFHSTC